MMKKEKQTMMPHLRGLEDDLRRVCDRWNSLRSTHSRDDDAAQAVAADDGREGQQDGTSWCARPSAEVYEAWQEETFRLRAERDAYIRICDMFAGLLGRLHDDLLGRLSEGSRVHDQFLMQESLSGLSKHEELCFHDYFFFTHPDRMREIMAYGSLLTTRPLTFLILREMGLSDDEITQVLHVSRDSIRQYRRKIAIAQQNTGLV